jgi:hypothetical protein
MITANIKHLRQEVVIAQEMCDDHKTSDFLAQLLDHWPENKGQISDGYHTFREIYDHRMTLFVAYLQLLQLKSNREAGQEFDPEFTVGWSYNHHESDKPMFEGMVIAWAQHVPTGKQISYHLGAEMYAPLLTHARIPEHPHAIKWDGHTSHDVIMRLTRWIIPESED